MKVLRPLGHESLHNDRLGYTLPRGRTHRCSNDSTSAAISAEVLAKFGNDAQREQFLPGLATGTKMVFAITEPDAGSNSHRIATTATRDGDVYRLSGTKWFVTDGDVASYFLVLAWAVDGLERQPTLFIVDKDLPGVEMTDDPDFTHNFPYRHPEFTFTDTPVPVESVLGEVGQGFDLTGEWFIEERVHIAARCCGACDRLIELGTEWALEREQFGSRIFDHQAISFMLADCAAETTAASTR